MIIGISGAMCAGKHSVGHLFADAFNCTHVSLSGLVEAEVLTDARSPTRAELQRRANHNRDEYGAEYFFTKGKKLWEDKASHGAVALAGIYTLGEADAVKESGGVMVHVECASSEMRFERLVRRASELNRIADMMTFREFLDADDIEASGPDECRQSVRQLEAEASFRIDNTGSLENLARLVRDLGRSLGLIERQAPSPLEELAQKTPGPEIDKYSSICSLERQAIALNALRKHLCRSDMDPTQRSLIPLTQGGHAVHHVGNQFARRLLPAFMIPDSDEALAQFRRVQPHTLDEEMALLTNDREFHAIHSQLARELSSSSQEVHDAVVAALTQIRKDDQQQFDTTERRSLAKSLETGVRVRVSPKSHESIRGAQERAGSGPIPVTEVLKNDRILESTGFRDAKVSHVVHDAVDHVWLFKLLNACGISDRYRDFFESIGDPERTDLFKREGETVASIGFGVRYWATMEIGFAPEYRIGDIRGVLEGWFDQSILEERHLHAFRLVRQLSSDPMQRESQSLGFVLSNYVAELDEQRRKHGEIKVKDSSTNRVVHSLNPWSPDFVCMLIDTHHALLDSHNKHRNNLFSVHLLLEEFLSSERPFERDELYIPVDRLLDLDFSGTSLPPERIEWISRHYGFTAIRDALV